VRTLDLLLFALGVALGALVAGWYFYRPRLNLTIKVNKMTAASTIEIGQTATATIAPTAAGVPDANVSAVVFGVTPPGAYTIAPGPTPLSAIYTAAVVGTGIVATVSAVNEAGVTLTDSAPLPNVNTLVADKLNLSITTP
jgi:hypothetical protein